MEKKESEKKAFLQNIQKKIALFFPEDAYSYTYQIVEDALDSGDLMIRPSSMLTCLQTALLDNKVLEVELDGMTRVYFSRIYDDLPDLEVIEKDGETLLKEPEYSTGDYLKQMNRIICLPLEPGMGNLHIRDAKKVMIRLFTSSSAIEFGTFFQDLAMVREIPVLCLSFPVIGRQVRGTRAFRAKVPANMDFDILVKGNKQRPNIQTKPIDISVNGMAIQIQKTEQCLFQEDEICTIHCTLDGELKVKVDGTVRHISKIREKKGIQYRFGIKFDLSSRAMAAIIESLVASAQRAHLKELSDKSEKSGITLVQ